MVTRYSKKVIYVKVIIIYKICINNLSINHLLYVIFPKTEIGKYLCITCFVLIELMLENSI